MKFRAVVSRVLLPMMVAYNRQRPGIRVLMYHRVRQGAVYDQLSVSPARFAEQMEYLAGNARLVSLSQAGKELASGIQASAVAVTFDDGYLDNLTEALPILEKFQIPATIFVTTQFCDQRRRHSRYSDEGGRLHLDWHEVKQLANTPLIEIGSHTCTHPFLSRLGNEQARKEIYQSRSELEAKLDRPITLFCYPSGDMSNRESMLAKEAGYTSAVTVAPGINRFGQSLFEIKRTEITDRDNLCELRNKLAGAYDLPHACLHWRRMRNFSSLRSVQTEESR